MWRPHVSSGLTWSVREVATPIILLGGNLLFNIIANASFKLSATSAEWRSFLAWQVIGNLAGFITVLTLTGLLRYLPLHVAYPVTAGLAVIGVQVVAARWLFGEAISSGQWLGTLFVIIGIVLVSRG
ncbi:MAG: SMR family transporter [Anaerolineae bacterium]